jgi:hypothetical protein
MLMSIGDLAAVERRVSLEGYAKARDTNEFLHFYTELSTMFPDSMNRMMSRIYR